MKYRIIIDYMEIIVVHSFPPSLVFPYPNAESWPTDFRNQLVDRDSTPFYPVMSIHPERQPRWRLPSRPVREGIDVMPGRDTSVSLHRASIC